MLTLVWEEVTKYFWTNTELHKSKKHLAYNRKFFTLQSKYVESMGETFHFY